MKTAIIYSRVSSDEQTKGYSLTDQEIRLRKYCENQGFKVISHFQDDGYSAKTFNRPQFNNLLEFAKLNKGKVDLLLFVNWSRFSRNTTEAYAMIKRLDRLHIEPQAIDQPLDLSIPENKMMLAFYLASPEVENDRRALNTIRGQRRALKSGKWPYKAALGYLNKRDEWNKPIMVPDEKIAPLIIEAFDLLSTGVYTTKEVWRKMKAKGLNCCEQNFRYRMQNKIYTGKIFIPAWKDEPSEWRNGVHQPIIDESTFDAVQAVLNKNTIVFTQPKNVNAIELPLRGVLTCKRCGRNITGSGSKGNGGRYYYYHCKSKLGCKERFKAEEAHEGLLRLLRSIQIKPESRELYQSMLKDYLNGSDMDKNKLLTSINGKLDMLNTRKARLQDMMLDGDILPRDYAEMRDRVEQDIVQCQLELAEVKNVSSDFEKYLNFAVDFLLNIESFYLKAPWNLKKKIIGSTFPKKLTFDGEKVRTNGLNEALALVLLEINRLEGNKKGSLSNFDKRPNKAPPLGLEPRTL